MRATIAAIVAVIVVAVTVPAWAAPTPAERCEADVELASAKYAQCRLTAEAKFSKSLDATTRATALARCSRKLQQSFAKAIARYGLNCTAVPVAEFDAYLTQCSDDATSAAAGAALPNYTGQLASCNADLLTCGADLSTGATQLALCRSEFNHCAGDLATCVADLAACALLPPARLLTTAQTTEFGAGSDGELQLGIERNYVDNGDGTITDTATGLMWEKKSDDGSIHDKDNTYTWTVGDAPPYKMDGTVATSFLSTLNSDDGFAGYTDWRLPNLIELESLRDLGSAAPATQPAFNMACAPGCTVVTCSCTRPFNTWSSSTYTVPNSAWYVDFAHGEASAWGKTSLYAARAVRGGS